MTVMVDASFLPTGVVLEVNGTLEDACWLCHNKDTKYINLAKLDTPLKALLRKAKVLNKALFTDLAYTHGFINDTWTKKSRLKI